MIIYLSGYNLQCCYNSSTNKCVFYLQKPRAWNLPAVQVWFQSVIATKDFIYFMYCLMFVTSHLYLKGKYFFSNFCFFLHVFESIVIVFNFIAVALIPILCRALEHVAKFLRRNFTRSSLYRYEKPYFCCLFVFHPIKCSYVINCCL